MERIYVEDKQFEKIDFSTEPPEIAEYDNCSFVNCNFEKCDLSNISFSDCKFNGCNLTMIQTVKTAFKDIKFNDCKLLGVHFEHCTDFLFAVQFENCILNYSSFFKKSLKKTVFRQSGLQEVDFTDADLSSAVFDKCDLNNAKFENTNLEKADFRSAYNFSIDPALNRMRKARFSMNGLPGLLNKFDIDIT
ncbi:MAG TPA: pentapeptide repeat-containing protein [Chitinophagaceae bacterium]